MLEKKQTNEYMVAVTEHTYNGKRNIIGRFNVVLTEPNPAVNITKSRTLIVL